MAILNSSVNFIIYVLASRKFRHDLFTLVRQGRCRCTNRPGGTDGETGRGQRWAGQGVSVTDDVSVFRLAGVSNAVVLETIEPARHVVVDAV